MERSLDAELHVGNALTLHVMGLLVCGWVCKYVIQYPCLKEYHEGLNHDDFVSLYGVNIG